MNGRVNDNDEDDIEMKIVLRQRARKLTGVGARKKRSVKEKSSETEKRRMMNVEKYDQLDRLANEERLTGEAIIPVVSPGNRYLTRSNRIVLPESILPHIAFK